MVLRVPATARIIAESSKGARAMFNGKYLGWRERVCRRSAFTVEKAESWCKFHILTVPSDAPVANISEFGSVEILVIAAWCSVRVCTGTNRSAGVACPRHIRRLWSADPLRRMEISEDPVVKNLTALTALV
jgi:hypothetical protein